MKATKKLIQVLYIIIKTRKNDLAMPVIITFLFENIGDFLEPKFSVITGLFFIFLIFSVYCIYKIYSWTKASHVQIPITQEKIFTASGGLNEDLSKGLLLSFIGLSISTVFLILQLFFSNNNKGALASLLPQLQPIQQTLLNIDKKLDTISNKLDNVKKETSDNARKELQNMGVAWNGKNFLDAVKTGDMIVTSLFLRGGMRPETAESDGRSLAIMLSLNGYNPDKILTLLLEYGLDINYPFPQFSALGDMKTTLLGRAIETGNIKLADALLKNNADTKSPLQTYGQMGIAIDKYPLQSAIYWKRKEITLLLLDADTDIAVGDFAAYRQAYLMKDDRYWKENEDALKQILVKTAPSGKNAEKINIELRIQEIENELNSITKKMWESYTNTYKKAEYEKRSEVLQDEKKKLQSKLTSLQ